MVNSTRTQTSAKTSWELETRGRSTNWVETIQSPPNITQSHPTPFYPTIKRDIEWMCLPIEHKVEEALRTDSLSSIFTGVTSSRISVFSKSLLMKWLTVKASLSEEGTHCFSKIPIARIVTSRDHQRCVHSFWKEVGSLQSPSFHPSIRLINGWGFSIQRYII